MNSIEALFLDVGGVLGTNGWDRKSRTLAAEKFGLEPDEMNERHHLTFDTYEEGKLSLDDYLDRVVFYAERNFTRDDFKEFMFSRSQPFPDMLRFMRELKQKYGLRVVVVSNEGRELTLHRVEYFQLKSLVDAFVFSCFAHFRKPDPDIWRMALDVSQVAPERVFYLDDRAMFIEIASTLGIRGHVHRSLEDTRAALAEVGLSLPAAVA